MKEKLYNFDYSFYMYVTYLKEDIIHLNLFKFVIFINLSDMYVTWRQFWLFNFVVIEDVIFYLKISNKI